MELFGCADGAARMLLIRHGKTFNPENRCYGWRNVPMDETGERQMTTLAAHLKDVRVDEVFSSDLERTRAAAAYFADSRNLPVQAISKLREIFFGEIEGLTFSEVEARFPETARHWVTHPETVKFPNGERFDDVCARVIPWCESWLKSSAGKTGLFVTHSGTIRAMLRWMTGCDPHATLMVKISYGDVLVCDWDAASGVWTRLEKWDAASARACVKTILAQPNGLARIVDDGLR